MTAPWKHVRSSLDQSIGYLKGKRRRLVETIRLVINPNNNSSQKRKEKQKETKKEVKEKVMQKIFEGI